MDSQAILGQAPASPRTKAELLERIRQSRAAMDQFLGELNEAQMLQRPGGEGWSVKDHLAHLAAWQRGISALLRRQPRWTAMGLGDAPTGSMDNTNERIHQLNDGRPLADVLADFRSSEHEMDGALSGLTDADLLKSYAQYGPPTAGIDESRPILGWIVGNTYDHYDEHLEWLRSSVKRPLK